MKGNLHLVNLEHGHCCLQVQNTHSFCSQQNGRIFTTVHQVNCKSNFVMYLLECKKCHIQYGGKTETYFKLRLTKTHHPKPKFHGMKRGLRSPTRI